MMQQKIGCKTLWRMISLVASLASLSALYLRWLWFPDFGIMLIAALPLLMGWVVIATWVVNELWWTPKQQAAQAAPEKQR